MNYLLECTYCGYRFEVTTYSVATLKERKCPKCSDRHLKVRHLEDTKVDTYAGSPPFVIKQDDTDYGY